MHEAGENRIWFDAVLYRSSYEARWRLFYWEMQIGCDYKPKPVEFDSESFAPDFFLSQKVWIIVKSTFPTTAEKAKALALAERSGYRVYFFYGEIPKPAVDDKSWYTASAVAFFPDGTIDEAYWWCECPICHSAGIEFEGRAARLPCESLKGKYPGWDPSHCYSERILKAYRTAREAKLTPGPDGYEELKKHNYI